MTRLLASALCVMAIVAAPAAAAPKVALTAIDGDSSGDVRDAVAEALDSKDLTLIGEKETNRAFDKLKLSDLSEKDAKKLASALEADAVVQPTLGKKGSSKLLKFKLFVNGKKTKGFSVQFKNAKSPKFKSALRDKMVEKISSGIEASEDDTRSAKKAKAEVDDEDPNPKAKKLAKDDDDKDDTEAKKDDDDDEDDDKKAEKADQEGDDEDAPRKGKKQTAAADDDDDDDEPAIAKRMEPKHAANRVAVRLDVGVAVANRTLKFNSRPNFPERPSHFKSAPVPGGRFEAEMYPLAFLNPKSILAGIGFAAEYEKTISLNLQSEMVGKKVPVDQSHYAIGARIRIPFGKTATSPTATLGIDYARRKFKADRTGLMPDELDLPDTHYRFFAPSVGFRIPIGRYVAFIANGEAMLVQDAGPIQKAESYGKAKVFGFAGQGGFDVIVGNRFAIRLTAELTQVGFTFMGAGGAEANSRDGDPDSKDVGGAADRSVGGAATLAVLY